VLLIAHTVLVRHACKRADRGETEKKLPEGCNMNENRNEFKVKRRGEMAEEEKLFHMRRGRGREQ
jgi:hypothetical protein